MNDHVARAALHRHHAVPAALTKDITPSVLDDLKPRKPRGGVSQVRNGPSVRKAIMQCLPIGNTPALCSSRRGHAHAPTHYALDAASSRVRAQARDGEYLNSMDGTAIGWNLIGQASAQEQISIQTHATLNTSRQNSSFNGFKDSPQDALRSAGIDLASAPPQQSLENPRPTVDLSGISLRNVIGETGYDTREISEIIWGEMCVPDQANHKPPSSGMFARISDDVDPSWARSLLYSAEDNISIDRDVLISRPIFSDVSGILSLVLADTAPAMDAHNHISRSGLGISCHDRGHRRSTAGETRNSVDIGFCTVEVKLLSSSHLINRNDAGALQLLDPRRMLPVRANSLGVNFNIVSLYLHPSYRRQGLGRTLASLVRTFVGYVVDELIEQISYQDYVTSARCGQHASASRSQDRLMSTGRSLDITISGASVDQRSDRLFQTILSGVLREYGGDRLSPASLEAYKAGYRLRALALACNDIASSRLNLPEREALAQLLRTIGQMHSFHPSQERSSPWGTVVTSVVDLVDWSSDH